MPVDTDEAKEVVHFSMFSGCYSSRKFWGLCHGLLVLFDGPAPAPDKVQAVSCVIRGDSNMNLADYVSGIVSFSPAETVALGLKIEADLDRQFPNNASKKRCNTRPIAQQLSILRHVVFAMFVGYTGNKAGTRKKTPVQQFGLRSAR